MHVDMPLLHAAARAAVGSPSRADVVAADNIDHEAAGCGTWSPTSECFLATAYVLNATTKMATSMHQMTNRSVTDASVYVMVPAQLPCTVLGKQGVKLSILVLLKIIIALLTTRGDQVVYPYHPVYPQPGRR